MIFMSYYSTSGSSEVIIYTNKYNLGRNLGIQSSMNFVLFVFRDDLFIIIEQILCTECSALSDWSI